MTTGMLTRSSVLLIAAVAATPTALARPQAKASPAVSAEEAKPTTPDYTVTSKARLTVHDAELGGCLDHGTQNDCSHFASPRDVYVSVGPSGLGLKDGEYFFAVLAPGYQTMAFLDGLDGNLSDRVAGSSTGDDGGGDLVANRSFTVTNEQITGYEGKHAEGRSSDGRLLIAAAPFDETPNRGNVYVLAVCEKGATRFDQCRFDAFQVGTDVPQLRAVVAGMAYYDANANGQFDPGEAGIHEGAVSYWDGDQGVAHIAMDGTFSTVVTPDELLFAQRTLGAGWIQTGNDVSQAVLAGDASLMLQDDQIYDLTVAAGSAVDGVAFGDVCLGEGGSHPRGYWASKVSLTLYGADDLDLIRKLNLRGDNGLPYDPASATDFQRWLRDDSSANQLTRLSAQLAVAALNVHNGFVEGNGLALMEGADAANNTGIGRVQRLIEEADGELARRGVVLPAETGVIAYRDALLRALSGLNENTTFVQASLLRCAPVDGMPANVGLEHGDGTK